MQQPIEMAKTRPRRARKRGRRFDRFAAHDASPLFPDRFGRVAIGSFAPFRMRFKITALDAGGPPGAAATREPGPGGAIERPRLIDGTA